MKRCTLSLFLFVLAPPCAPAGDPATTSAAELVRQLGSSSFRDRESAYDELVRRGSGASSVLELGLRSEDREIRRRCQDLLRQIEEAELRAQLLPPHLTRFRFDKTPLRSALLEVEERTGLQAVAPEPVGRRVSLDTGEVPFWQAWERFCKDAGLCEPDETFEPPGRGGPQVKLQNGKSDAAAYLGSPLRVRALSAVAVVRGIAAEVQYGGPVAAVLEICAEPHLDLLAIDAVRIRKVRAHDGKVLMLAGSVTQRPVHVPELLVDAEGRPVHGKAGWLIPIWLPGLTRLQPPRELAGVIEARFLVRRTCLTIPAPLEAVGKTFAGKRGVALTVRAAAISPDGTVTLTVQLEHPDGLLAAGPGDQMQRIRPGVVIARDPLAALLDGLELHDAKGRPLPRADLVRHDDAGLCVVSFRDIPEGGKGLRLVLMARHVVRMEMEFTLGK
jgi:hypothetical protein